MHRYNLTAATSAAKLLVSVMKLNKSPWYFNFPPSSSESVSGGVHLEAAVALCP